MVSRSAVTNVSAPDTIAFDGVAVERFATGRHLANAYLVYSLSERRCMVIDPGADAELLIARLTELRLSVAGVLLTHGHWDHVGAAGAVATYAGAPVYLHPADRALLKAAPIYAFRIDGVRLRVPKEVLDLVEGARIPLGSTGEFSVRHVPGHTAGGVVLRLEHALFTGDTLLPEQIGRFDLPGGNPGRLQQSLDEIARDLTPVDVVCPGHGEFWPASEAARWLATRKRTPHREG